VRSSRGRAALVIGLVLVVSFAMAVPRFEIAEIRAETRGRDFSRMQIFLHELYGWGLWGLAWWPIQTFARWLMRSTGAWIVFLLVQLPLSGLAGWGFVELHHTIQSRFEVQTPNTDQERQRPLRSGEEIRPPGERGQGRPGGRGLDRPGRRWQGRAGEEPVWDSPRWRFRWMQATLVYWVLLVMGAGLHSFLGMRDKERRAAELELRAERLRAELARAQVSTLRNQVNPHFLFNALHSVGGLVRAGEEEAALKTLAAIGELLRSTLEQGEVDEVPLRDELGIARRYLEIEEIRLGDRLVVSIDTDDGALDARLPTLLLLPLVENAVLHGLSPLTEGGQVTIRAWREGPSLHLEVTDNGLGFPPRILASGGSKSANGRRSIGLDNTRARLEALYADRQLFQLENIEPRGARVHIVLPYHEKDDPSGLTAAPEGLQS
jgi:signal transduction histidine kinase